MTEETPQAAGNGSQTNPAESFDQPAPPRTDDELRRYAVEQLAEHLTIGVDLAARCQNLSLRSESDKVGPINAAARLMQANARIAEALASVAQVERRRRTIVEVPQKVDKKKAELNSYFQKQKMNAETERKIWNRMNEHVENSIRARMGDKSAEDRIAYVLNANQKKLDYVNKSLAEIDGNDG